MHLLSAYRLIGWFQPSSYSAYQLIGWFQGDAFISLSVGQLVSGGLLYRLIDWSFGFRLLVCIGLLAYQLMGWLHAPIRYQLVGLSVGFRSTIGFGLSAGFQMAAPAVFMHMLLKTKLKINVKKKLTYS